MFIPLASLLFPQAPLISTTQPRLHERHTLHAIMPMVQWAAIRYSMIPKSGYRFSDKIMLKQNLRPMEPVS
jgi:hypothetical protein